MPPIPDKTLHGKSIFAFFPEDYRPTKARNGSIETLMEASMTQRPAPQTTTENWHYK
jgi:hypothetical protein